MIQVRIFMPARSVRYNAIAANSFGSKWDIGEGIRCLEPDAAAVKMVKG